MADPRPADRSGATRAAGSARRAAGRSRPAIKRARRGSSPPSRARTHNAATMPPRSRSPMTSRPSQESSSATTMRDQHRTPGGEGADAGHVDEFDDECHREQDRVERDAAGRLRHVRRQGGRPVRSLGPPRDGRDLDDIEYEPPSGHAQMESGTFVCGSPRYAVEQRPKRLTGVGRSASRSGWPGDRTAMKLLARLGTSEPNGSTVLEGPARSVVGEDDDDGRLGGGGEDRPRWRPRPWSRRASAWAKPRSSDSCVERPSSPMSETRSGFRGLPSAFEDPRRMWRRDVDEDEQWAVVRLFSDARDRREFARDPIARHLGHACRGRQPRSTHTTASLR